MKKVIGAALAISICILMLAGCKELAESAKVSKNTVNATIFVTNSSDISITKPIIKTTKVGSTTEKNADVAQITLSKTAKTIVKTRTKRKTGLTSSSKSICKQTQSVKNNANLKSSTENKTISTTENKKVIDIAYYETYAKSYAKQIGLSYDSSATDCWDNPIIVSTTNGSYVKRDIRGYLNSYKNVEGFESICVWSKKRTDGKYDLYIGYS